jgi:Transmembrane protein 33/Nucleoporin POM33
LTFYCFVLIIVTLAPYAIYSAFHIAEYARVHLLHHKPETQRMLKDQKDKHYSRAMLLAAEVEVFGVMGRLFLGAIT